MKDWIRWAGRGRLLRGARTGGICAIPHKRLEGSLQLGLNKPNHRIPRTSCSISQMLNK